MGPSARKQLELLVKGFRETVSEEISYIIIIIIIIYFFFFTAIELSLGGSSLTLVEMK
jgi:hypothetical protein